MNLASLHLRAMSVASDYTSGSRWGLSEPLLDVRLRALGNHRRVLTRHRSWSGSLFTEYRDPPGEQMGRARVQAEAWPQRPLPGPAPVGPSSPASQLCRQLLPSSPSPGQPGTTCREWGLRWPNTYTPNNWGVFPNSITCCSRGGLSKPLVTKRSSCQVVGKVVLGLLGVLVLILVLLGDLGQVT